MLLASSVIDSYFSSETMSIHIKSWNHCFSKVGNPWSWEFLSWPYMKEDELSLFIETIFNEISTRSDAFLEIDRKYSKVAQLGLYRIVVVYPPLSDALEITIVRPIKKLSLIDYHLDEKIIQLLREKSQWILVSWAPWSWKTTFAQALIERYVDMKKIVKTIESPRDLLVPKEVTQYSFTHGTYDEIIDILLLSRPDFTVYDEVRNTNDFALYKDLRLTWIGLVWVIHATNPIDSIQRFIGNIEFWVIPQVIDTVFFIEWGFVKEIYTLSLVVKVPTGMPSADLARPVIDVKDYLTGEVLYELYSFGEQIVVIPLTNIAKESKQSPSDILAQQYLNDLFSTMFVFKTVNVVNRNEVTIYVSDTNKGSIIGKGWENIMRLEKKIGMRISVKSFDDFYLQENPSLSDLQWLKEKKWWKFMKSKWKK